jgi:hypothetical protein
VPEDLLKQLHDANTRLHAARIALEQAMDDSEPDHQKRVNASNVELEAAERAVEEISLRVHGSLKAPPQAQVQAEPGK